MSAYRRGGWGEDGSQPSGGHPGPARERGAPPLSAGGEGRRGSAVPAPAREPSTWAVPRVPRRGAWVGGLRPALVGPAWRLAARRRWWRPEEVMAFRWPAGAAKGAMGPVRLAGPGLLAGSGAMAKWLYGEAVPGTRRREAVPLSWCRWRRRPREEFPPAGEPGRPREVRSPAASVLPAAARAGKLRESRPAPAAARLPELRELWMSEPGPGRPVCSGHPVESGGPRRPEGGWPGARGSPGAPGGGR